jgi:hypothetical protein
MRGKLFMHEELLSDVGIRKFVVGPFGVVIENERMNSNQLAF